MYMYIYQIGIFDTITPTCTYNNMYMYMYSLTIKDKHVSVKLFE